MFDSLAEELRDRGIAHGPLGDLEDFAWSQDKETLEWLLLRAALLIEAAGDPTEAWSPEKSVLDASVLGAIEVPAVLCMARACEFAFTDSVVPKSLGRIALGAIQTQNLREPGMIMSANLLSAHGHYMDCLLFFEEKLEGGVYDETFATDIATHLGMLGGLHDWSIERLRAGSDDEDRLMHVQAYRSTIGLMMKSGRGALLQMERGLRVMSEDDIAHAMQAMAPELSDVCNRVTEVDGSQLDGIMYTLTRAFVAYFLFMIGNLGGPWFPEAVPQGVILEEAVNACLDDYAQKTGEEMDGVTAFHSLFAHILRLRLLSNSSVREGPIWENAVSKALEAAQKSERAHRGWEAYGATIRSLVDTGRIGDMDEYARVLSRNP